MTAWNPQASNIYIFIKIWIEKNNENESLGLPGLEHLCFYSDCNWKVMKMTVWSSKASNIYILFRF